MSDVVEGAPRPGGRAVRRAAVVCLIVAAAVAPSAYLWSSFRAASRELAAARAEATAARAEAAAARADARDARARAAAPWADSGPADPPAGSILIPLAPPGLDRNRVFRDLWRIRGIRGTIRAKRNINGVEYAIVTVGSADQVAKGMRFKVVAGNTFLGYLTVDSVEPNESVGHLEGPQLAAVRPGAEVRAQW